MDFYILYIHTLCGILFANLYFAVVCAQNEELITAQVQSDTPRDRTHHHDHDGHGEGDRYSHVLLEEANDPAEKILVTTVLEPPYMMLTKHWRFLTGNDRYEGLLADMLDTISERAGIVYEIRICNDGLHGQQGENGTWSGMIGEILRGEAQLAVGPITVTHKRSHVVQFSEPFMSFQSSAILKRPRHRKHERVPRSRSKIRTLEELHQADIQYGVISGSLTSSLIKQSADPLLNAMWFKMTSAWPEAFVYTAQEGVQRAERENYAFITDSPFAEYVTIRKPCHLYKTGNFLDRQYYAFAVQKGDTLLKDSIDEQILLMRVNGELEALRNKWWVNECDRKRDAHADGVDTYARKTTLSPWRFATAKVSQSVENAAARFYVNLSVFIVLLFLTFGAVGWSL